MSWVLLIDSPNISMQSPWVLQGRSKVAVPFRKRSATAPSLAEYLANEPSAQSAFLLTSKRVEPLSHDSSLTQQSFRVQCEPSRFGFITVQPVVLSSIAVREPNTTAEYGTAGSAVISISSDDMLALSVDLPMVSAPDGVAVNGKVHLHWSNDDTAASAASLIVLTATATLDVSLQPYIQPLAPISKPAVHSIGTRLVQSAVEDSLPSMVNSLIRSYSWWCASHENFAWQEETLLSSLVQKNNERPVEQPHAAQQGLNGNSGSETTGAPLRSGAPVSNTSDAIISAQRSIATAVDMLASDSERAPPTPTHKAIELLQEASTLSHRAQELLDGGDNTDDASYSSETEAGNLGEITESELKHALGHATREQSVDVDSLPSQYTRFHVTRQLEVQVQEHAGAHQSLERWLDDPSNVLSVTFKPDRLMQLGENAWQVQLIDVSLLSWQLRPKFDLYARKEGEGIVRALGRNLNLSDSDVPDAIRNMNIVTDIDSVLSVSERLNRKNGNTDSAGVAIVKSELDIKFAAELPSILKQIPAFQRIGENATDTVVQLLETGASKRIQEAYDKWAHAQDNADDEDADGANQLLNEST